METEFESRTPAWTGLGTDVAKAGSSREALRYSGLDWNVSKQTMTTDSGVLVKGFLANIRETDGQKTIEQKLKVYMGDAEIAENDHFLVSWKNSRTERLDTKTLKQEQPEIYRRYAKITESRRFLVKAV